MTTQPVRPYLALAESAAAELDAMLGPADEALARDYPGERPGRQPVHTVYLPADRFTGDVVPRWGREALGALALHASGPREFGAAMGLDAGLAPRVRERVLAKLAAEPVEDLRLDFEDGYGHRGDPAEDADALAAARALADAAAAGQAPPFTGIRAKSLERATRGRAIRTVAVFVGELAARGLPAGFVLTLPKVTSVEQVRAMAHLCGRLEEEYGLPPGRLGFEVQAETPQLILGAGGTATVARCLHESGGRLTALHYGTYDYSASLGIAARYQSMEHPAADHARAVLQVAAAGTGVRLSDGSSNVLPEGGHADVLAAWQLHARLVRRSLERGFYQGWDLHPRQLASRYAATYGFFLQGFPDACRRLASYTQRAESGVLEEPATARALAGYLVRGLDCGAVAEADVVTGCGLGRAGLAALAAAGQLASGAPG